VNEITPGTAIVLGAVFGTSAIFWLNLETTYRLAHAAPAIAVRARQAPSTIQSFRRKRKKTEATPEVDLARAIIKPAPKRSKRRQAGDTMEYRAIWRQASGALSRRPVRCHHDGRSARRSADALIR
jgi:hypothetical protein